ncbi:MAG: hypothetical protein ACRDLZ_10930 [Gaiellaceae bacterium]
MSEPTAPEVSWKGIEQGAAVLASDGSEVARVVEVAGDRTADIFSGLVVTSGALGADRYLAAERVTAIWPRRVQADLTSAEIASLPPYEEPVVERLQTESFFTRLRRRLFP